MVGYGAKNGVKSGKMGKYGVKIEFCAHKKNHLQSVVYLNWLNKILKLMENFHKK